MMSKKSGNNHSEHNLEKTHSVGMAEISNSAIEEILNLISQAIIGIDAQSKVVLWNSGAEKLIGITGKQAYGKAYQTILVVFSTSLQEIESARLNAKAYSINKLDLVVNDKEQCYAINIYPLSDVKVKTIIEIIEITDKIKIENIMIRTEKMATLGTLTAGMTHEFNNHLSGIMQSMQNIEKRLDQNFVDNQQIAQELNLPLDKLTLYLERRGVINFLHGAKDLSNRSAEIVRSVLKFSHSSAPTMELTDINKIIEEIMMLFVTDGNIKNQINIEHLKISTDLSPNLPQIYCMPSEIEQVLLNLIKNACHAMHEKEYPSGEEPELLVRTTPAAGQIYVDVIDNGIGISKQVKHHLFEAFFTTKAIGMGTGLGLSISRYIIVERHKGNIVIESEEGIGSIFRLELPVAGKDT